MNTDNKALHNSVALESSRRLKVTRPKGPSVNSHARKGVENVG